MAVQPQAHLSTVRRGKADAAAQAGTKAQPVAATVAGGRGGQPGVVAGLHDRCAQLRAEVSNLNVVDDYPRECLAIEVDTSLGGARVVRVLEGLQQRRGLPRRIRSDNGPEFVSRAVDQWAYEQGLEWHTIQPGRPMENGYVESFNRRFRDECRNENWFRDLADARVKIAEWQQDYNEKRPHSSLQYRTPVEFAAQAASFYRAGLVQETSNAGPLLRTPVPAMLLGEQNAEKVSLSLD